MRPDILAFVENVYPISLVLAICTALGAIIELQHVSVWFRNPICRLLLLLQIPVGLSVIFAVHPLLVVDRYNFYIRMILVLLLIPVLIRTERDLRNLLLVAALSLGVIALRFGVYGVMHGGVDLAAMGYGEMLGDNNFAALAFGMLIPLCWYCRALTERKIPKNILLLIVGSALAAVVMSGSRGGSIATVLGVVLIIGRSQRKAMSLIVLACFAGGSIYLVQDAYFSRMKTLETYQDDASAESRVVHAQTALRVWADHPVLGVGFGGMVYASMARDYSNAEKDVVANHVVHNSYLQVLVDSGLIAFLLYTGLFGYAILWLGRSAQGDPARRVFPLAIQTPLLVFALGSSFYSCERMDLPYIFLMMAAAWQQIERNSATDDASNGEFEGLMEMNELAVSG